MLQYTYSKRMFVTILTGFNVDSGRIGSTLQTQVLGATSIVCGYQVLRAVFVLCAGVPVSSFGCACLFPGGALVHGVDLNVPALLVICEVVVVIGSWGLCFVTVSSFAWWGAVPLLSR